MRLAIGLVTLMAMTLTALTSQASSLEKLLMPGELSGAHAKFETECGSCHDRADKTRQREQCLGCHDHSDIAADIGRGDGFHGRAARKAQCNACHSEHKGRQGDIVHFDAEGFDHRKTDFPLTGAHSAAACAGCHKEGRKFQGLLHTEQPVQPRSIQRRVEGSYDHRLRLEGSDRTREVTA